MHNGVCTITKRWIVSNCCCILFELPCWYNDATLSAALIFTYWTVTLTFGTVIFRNRIASDPMMCRPSGLNRQSDCSRSFGESAIWPHGTVELFVTNWLQAECGETAVPAENFFSCFLLKCKPAHTLGNVSDYIFSQKKSKQFLKGKICVYAFLLF